VNHGSNWIGVSSKPDNFSAQYHDFPRQLHRRQQIEEGCFDAMTTPVFSYQQRHAFPGDNGQDRKKLPCVFLRTWPWRTHFYPSGSRATPPKKKAGHLDRPFLLRRGGAG